MKGYPKYLNSKEDYLFVKDNFEKSLWSKDYQELLEDTTMWANKGNVDKTEGITDVNHKVLKSDKDGVTEYTQFELVANPDCKLLMLGFTKAEVEAAIESADTETK